MTVTTDVNTRSAPVGARRLRVFISYSRLDLEFVDRVQEALKNRGIEASVDREDIEKGEAWWARIQQLITEADTIVFVLSPDSASSPICQREVDFAEGLNKRFIPVVARDIGGLAAPLALARLNYVFFVPHAGTPGDFETSADELTRALETDIPWIREHTRLGVLAQRWEGHQRPQDLLLRGGELATAEAWFTSRPRNAPDPTDAHRALVTESRRAATHRQRRALAFSFLAVAVSLSLAAIAYLKQVEAQQTLAASDFTNGTRLFLEPATAHEGLKLLASAADLESRERALIRLTTAAQQNVFWVKGPAPIEAPAVKVPELPPQYARFTIGGESFKTISHAFSADGQRIAVSVSDENTHPDIRVAVFDRGKQVTDWFVPKEGSDQWLYDVRVALSPDGRFLATERQDWRSASYIQVHDLSGKKPIGTPIRASGTVSAYQQRGFRVTKFLSKQQFDYTEDEQLYLLVGSERGDASVYSVGESDSKLLFNNQHGEAVVAAVVGGREGQEILVSFDGAFTGKVTGVRGNKAKHPDIQAEFAPQRIEIAVDGGSISLFGANGETAQFSLIAPSERISVLGETVESGLPPAATSVPQMPYCQLPAKHRPPPDENGLPPGEDSDPTEKRASERAVQFFAARGHIFTLEGRRLTLKDTKGAAIASRYFPWSIAAVCAAQQSGQLAIAFDNLDVEIWRGDLSVQVGARIKQLSYFKGEWRPDQFTSAQVSKDARKILTVTHFWNYPHNVFSWISLYDVATGLPLMEILNSAEEGLDFGILSDDSSHIVLGKNDPLALDVDTAFKPIRAMRLLPSPSAKASLIAHMARIAERLPPQGATK